MKIGIGLPNQVRNLDPRIIPAWASQGEEAGFSSLGTICRFAYPSVSDTVALAAAAGATSRIGLLSHVLVAPAWPPYLLAKEIAGIDGVSGGRLTLGVGIGVRDDDFTVPGLGMRGRGKRMDADLEIYKDVWDGKPVLGGPNPAVPAGTRRVPLLFGANSEVAMRRAAREGDGWLGPNLPIWPVTDMFDMARAAWVDAGRTDTPRLVGLHYYAFRDPKAGAASVRDYYLANGVEFADMYEKNVAGGPQAIRDAVQLYADAGADELILIPCLAELDEISRLADTVL